MKYSDLTPQERRLVFLFELARSLLAQSKQFPPTEQSDEEDTYHEDQ